MTRVCETCGKEFDRECATCREACRHEVAPEDQATLAGLAGRGDVEIYQYASGANEVTRQAFIRALGGPWHTCGVRWETHAVTDFRGQTRQQPKWPSAVERADHDLLTGARKFFDGRSVAV